MGLSHLPNCLGITPARLSDSYLLLSPSTGTTFSRISFVCLWPKAVVHGYILVVMCIKRDESIKAESNLEKRLGSMQPASWGKAAILLSDLTRLGYSRSVQSVCAASDGRGLTKYSLIGFNWADYCFELLYCMKIS